MAVLEMPFAQRVAVCRETGPISGEERAAGQPLFGVLRRFRLALLPLAISGCTTTKYVTVPCTTPDQLEQLRQAEPPKVGDKLSGKADEDIRIVAGSAVRLRSWGKGLLGVIEGCTG